MCILKILIYSLKTDGKLEMVVVDTSRFNEKNDTAYAMSAAAEAASSKNGILESATYANGFFWETSILFNRNLTNIFRV